MQQVQISQNMLPCKSFLFKIYPHIRPQPGHQPKTQTPGWSETGQQTEQHLGGAPGAETCWFGLAVLQIRRENRQCCALLDWTGGELSLHFCPVVLPYPKSTKGSWDRTRFCNWGERGREIIPCRFFFFSQVTLKFSRYSYLPYPVFTALTLIRLEIGWFCPSHVYTEACFIWLSSFRDQFLLCGRRDY